MDYKEKLIVLLNNTELSEEQKAKLEEIFPELCESENDRIKKFIENELVCLRACYDEGTERHEQLSNAIAWLEKQGETFTKKDVDDAYLKGVCDTKHELEKQGEQKPVVVPKFKVGDTVRAKTMNDFVFTIKDITDKQYIDTNGGKFDIEGQDYLELIEQKPKWSEEDESWFKELELMALSFSNDDSYRKKFFDWRKSIKDRIQPQSYWKPSDEQINALEKECIAHSNYELCRLLEQLKKLREE